MNNDAYNSKHKNKSFINSYTKDMYKRLKNIDLSNKFVKAHTLCIISSFVDFGRLTRTYSTVINKQFITFTLVESWIVWDTMGTSGRDQIGILVFAPGNTVHASTSKSSTYCTTYKCKTAINNTVKK